MINSRGGKRLHEKEITALLRDRDDRGMDELLRHYGPLIRYVIAPILHNPQDREECLAETVMKVWDKIEQFCGQKGRFNAWVTSIARNSALNHARKNSAQGYGEELSESIPSQALTPEEQVLQRERREELRQALQYLSEKERVLFYRKYYYRQSTEQIAAEMDLTVRAVEGKLYRIKGKLRKMLGGV